MDGNITIQSTGSANNGLWSPKGSDIDVVVVFHSHMAHNQHSLIKYCAKLIRKIAAPGTLCYVPAVKVPIIKYRDEMTGIDVDISINNILAMANSDLVYTYCQVD